MSKISIIGAGQVGAATAVRLVDMELVDDITLFDVVEDMPQGKALDIAQSTPVIQKQVKIVGTNDYKDIANSDIVVVTAGFPRKPGMDRLDLLAKTIEINKSVSQNILKYAPNTIVLYVANPLDLMTYVCHKLTKFPASRVFGMAGVLDTTRFRTFVAMETGYTIRDVQAQVMGGHGDAMVPLVRYCSVAGVPLTELLPQAKIDAIVDRTKKGGGEIVKLLKSGSAYYAPGAAVAQMCQAIIRDEKRILPVCVQLNGEYGFKGPFVGVPVVLGRKGVERVLQLQLNDGEKALLAKSVADLQVQLDEIEKGKMYQ